MSTKNCNITPVSNSNNHLKGGGVPKMWGEKRENFAEYNNEPDFKQVAHKHEVLAGKHHLNN